MVATTVVTSVVVAVSDRGDDRGELGHCRGASGGSQHAAWSSRSLPRLLPVATVGSASPRSGDGGLDHLSSQELLPRPREWLLLQAETRRCGAVVDRLWQEGAATSTAASAARGVAAPKVVLGLRRRSGRGNRRRRERPTPIRQPSPPIP